MTQGLRKKIIVLIMDLMEIMVIGEYWNSKKGKDFNRNASIQHHHLHHLLSGGYSDCIGLCSFVLSLFSDFSLVLVDGHPRRRAETIILGVRNSHFGFYKLES